MKKIFWTIGVALVGFWFGWFGQAYPFNFALLVIFTVWGACIGYGFGSIFTQRIPTRRLIIEWAITIALVGSLLFPFVPLRLLLAQVGVAAAMGALVGTLIGTFQLKLARHKLQAAELGHPR
jgi:hypothetical protein